MISKKTLTYGRTVIATLSAAALLSVGAAYHSGIASAAPQGSEVAVGGFFNLGVYAPLCDDKSTPELGDATDFAEVNGVSALEVPTELRLEHLGPNGVWSVVADDGVEVFVNKQPVNGHDALWAHATVHKGDLFEIRHHGPADGSVQTYRLLLWAEGAKEPQKRIDSTEVLFPTPGFCEEARLAGAI
ncbi:hypothetical protein I8H83_00270 [Candidatus Saccharibacteria bacterium]|nr:hypothetical protein [Candidatus Saccharibacteria bacterium]MBH2007025.1 hypothetical protein [Candidatus Saccharibacteria bacterium]